MAVTYDTLQRIYAFSSATDALAGKQRVERLYWISKGCTVGDDLLVVDTASNVLWAPVADDTNINLAFVINGPVEGIRLKTHDSGTLYIVLASNEKDYLY